MTEGISDCGVLFEEVSAIFATPPSTFLAWPPYYPGRKYQNANYQRPRNWDVAHLVAPGVSQRLPAECPCDGVRYDVASYPKADYHACRKHAAKLPEHNQPMRDVDR